MNSALDSCIRSFASALRPPELLTISEWADKYRRLSSEASASRGKWSSWPFQREPMDCMSPTHPCERAVLMCGSQMLKTEAILNATAYVIDNDPGPILIVEPDEDSAESLSKDRITPMLRDTPRLAGKVVEAKSRDAGNTILHKKFSGGHLTLVGAKSPSGLAMRPIRYLFLDEIDRYPKSAGAEGDPVRLAYKRTVNFWNRKILLCSTPTIEGESRIAYEYELSDKRQYYVPCPFCNFEQVLVWVNVVWGTLDSGTVIEPRDARYRCENCKRLIRNKHKYEMLERGRWIASNPKSRIPGFHISQLYSPKRSWGELAEEFLEAKSVPTQLQTFVNTVLAETWKDRGEKPDFEKLKARIEPYQLQTVPFGALFLTAGVDVQKDRIEMQVIGWGRNREKWLVDYRIMYGDTARADVWNELTEAISVTYRHESGAQMSILRVGIDSGYATTEVYEWARRFPSNVMAIKGYEHGAGLLGKPKLVDLKRSGSVIKRSVRVWTVAVSIAKHELYGYLRQDPPSSDESYPVGWFHFCAPPQGDEYFRQLTAEEYVVTKDRRGFARGEWVKSRDRNEALDSYIYARAVAEQILVRGESQLRKFERSLVALPDSEQEFVYSEQEPVAPVKALPTGSGSNLPAMRERAPVSGRAARPWLARSTFLDR